MKTIQELHASKYCADCGKIVETYWELCSCDRNPTGLSDPPTEHGNNIDGTITCEDDYCNPCFDEVDKEMISPDYIMSHEVNERCCECGQFMESMGDIVLGCANNCGRTVDENDNTTPIGKVCSVCYYKVN